MPWCPFGPRTGTFADATTTTEGDRIVERTNVGETQNAAPRRPLGRLGRPTEGCRTGGGRIRRAARNARRRRVDASREQARHTLVEGSEAAPLRGLRRGDRLPCETRTRQSRRETARDVRGGARASGHP